MATGFDSKKLKKSLFSLSVTGTEEGPVLDNVVDEAVKSPAYQRHVDTLTSFREAQEASLAEPADAAEKKKIQAELRRKSTTQKRSGVALEKLMGISRVPERGDCEGPPSTDRSAPDYALSEVLLKAHKEAHYR